MPTRETRDQKIARLGYEYKQATARRDAADKEASDLNEELMKLIPRGKENRDVPYGEYSLDLIHVDSGSNILDEVEFLKHVKDDVKDDITVRRLDQRLLQVAVEQGTVSPGLVKEYTDRRPNKGYVKVTMKKRPTT